MHPLKAASLDVLPTISLVTPSFNQGAFIERTLHSVFDQGYPKLEYILLDGGSTDETLSILDRYRHRFAYIQSAPDGGQTAALIDGFARSTGDIQGWLCSDDLLEPESLWEVAAFFLENGDADVVYGDSYWIEHNDRPIRPKKEHAFNRFIWLHLHNYIPQPSTFWRRQLYERVGGLNPEMNLAMDADLWIRFAEVTRIHHVPRVWSRMRSYPEQKNQRFRGASDREDAKIKARYMRGTSKLAQTTGRVIALSMRISWKLAKGCYW